MNPSVSLVTTAPAGLHGQVLGSYRLVPTQILASDVPQILPPPVSSSSSYYHVHSVLPTELSSNLKEVENKDVNEDDDDDDDDDDIHVCGTCKAQFKNLEEFLSHKRSHRKEKKKDNVSKDDEEAVISLLANNLSAQKKGRKEETERENKEIERDDDDHDIVEDLCIDEGVSKSSKPIRKPTSYACNVVGCNFTSKYSKDLVRHMRRHTGEKPFTCTECGKSFSRQDKLKNHSRIHSGEKLFSCSQCSYRSSDSSGLQKHLRVHSNERPFQCQICPYRSKDSSQLTVHLRTHTGDSPFGCPYDDCSASFKTNSDLKRHVRTHTGEKPYACPHCDHKCAIKSNLRNHIKVHHQRNEGIKCQFCEFQSANRDELKKHESEHSSCLFSCQQCSYSTRSKTSLNYHARKKHAPKNSLKCSYCDFMCNWEGALSAHINKKHGKMTSNKKDKDEQVSAKKTWLTKSNCVPNFECNQCDAGFVRKDSLESHLRQHERIGRTLHNQTVEVIPGSVIQQGQVFVNPTTASSSSANTEPFQQNVVKFAGENPYQQHFSSSNVQSTSIRYILPEVILPQNAVIQFHSAEITPQPLKEK